VTGQPGIGSDDSTLGARLEVEFPSSGAELGKPPLAKSLDWHVMTAMEHNGACLPICVAVQLEQMQVQCLNL
jgi:hypothetical protein